MWVNVEHFKRVIMKMDEMSNNFELIENEFYVII